nr:MAG TPA: hypothetical protein [Caudoviricetes sp.]
MEIIAESRRVLLEKRLVDQKYKWNQAPLEEVVRILFEEQNRKSPERVSSRTRASTN